MQARFPEGTFDRIQAVLKDDEDRTDFVREAVERELRRRERHGWPAFMIALPMISGIAGTTAFPSADNRSIVPGSP
jgi:hypothetical protein